MPGLQSSTPAQARDVSSRELDLISAAQRGDVSAFNQLVRTHQELAYQFAFYVLDDAHAAERATACAFETMYRQIKHWKGEAFRISLLRTVIEQCKHAARFRNRAKSAPAESLVELGLATLAPNERVMCVLADVLGLADGEIAQITNAPLSTVRAQRSHARRQIRDVLQIHGAAREPTPA